jgi:hypothetical protein
VARCGAALSAQFEFEFSQGRHDGCHCAPNGSGGINSFSQGAQHDLAFTEVGNGSGDFGDRTPKPVDGRYDNGVAGSRVVEQCCKSWALRFG